MGVESLQGTGGAQRLMFEEEKEKIEDLIKLLDETHIGIVRKLRDDESGWFACTAILESIEEQIGALQEQLFHIEHAKAQEE